MECVSISGVKVSDRNATEILKRAAAPQPQLQPGTGNELYFLLPTPYTVIPQMVAEQPTFTPLVSIHRYKDEGCWCVMWS